MLNRETVQMPWVVVSFMFSKSRAVIWSTEVRHDSGGWCEPVSALLLVSRRIASVGVPSISVARRVWHRTRVEIDDWVTIHMPFRMVTLH